MEPVNRRNVKVKKKKPVLLVAGANMEQFCSMFFGKVSSSYVRWFSS
jgi:hypothetical protein